MQHTGPCTRAWGPWRWAAPCPDRSHRALATLALSDSDDLETSKVSIPPARQELELARHFQADQVQRGISLESGLCYVCSPPSGGFSGSLHPAFEGNLMTPCLELISQLISLVLKSGHHHAISMYSPHLREGSWGACPKVSTFSGEDRGEVHAQTECLEWTTSETPSSSEVLRCSGEGIASGRG